MAKTGRPSVYNEEIAARICTHIADGKSLRSFCRENDDSPALSTITLWIVDNPQFSVHYRRAREAGGFSHADDILDTADKVLSGELDPQSAKVVMDAKKWAAERMAPKSYSQRQAVEHTGKDGGPIETKALSDMDVARGLAFLLAKGMEEEKE